MKIVIGILLFVFMLCLINEENGQKMNILLMCYLATLILFVLSFWI